MTVVSNWSLAVAQMEEAVTPSDTVDFVQWVARWLRVLAAWNIVYLTPSAWPDWTETAHTMTWATVWTVINALIVRVNSTWTTATVSALY